MKPNPNEAPACEKAGSIVVVESESQNQNKFSWYRIHTKYPWVYSQQVPFVHLTHEEPNPRFLSSSPSPSIIVKRLWTDWGPLSIQESVPVKSWKRDSNFSFHLNESSTSLIQPKARKEAAWTVWNTTHWILSGGRDQGSSQIMSDHWFYEPNQQKWTTISSKLMKPRYGHITALLNSRWLLTVGGRGINGTDMTSTVEILDVQSKENRVITPFSKNTYALLAPYVVICSSSVLLWNATLKGSGLLNLTTLHWDKTLQRYDSSSQLRLMSLETKIGEHTLPNWVLPLIIGLVCLVVVVLLLMSFILCRMMGNFSNAMKRLRPDIAMPGTLQRIRENFKRKERQGNEQPPIRVIEPKTWTLQAQMGFNSPLVQPPTLPSKTVKQSPHSAYPSHLFPNYQQKNYQENGCASRYPVAPVNQTQVQKNRKLSSENIALYPPKPSSPKSHNILPIPERRSSAQSQERGSALILANDVPSGLSRREPVENSSFDMNIPTGEKKCDKPAPLPTKRGSQQGFVYFTGAGITPVTLTETEDAAGCPLSRPITDTVFRNRIDPMNATLQIQPRAPPLSYQNRASPLFSSAHSFSTGAIYSKSDEETKPETGRNIHESLYLQ